MRKQKYRAQSPTDEWGEPVFCSHSVLCSTIVGDFQIEGVAMLEAKAYALLIVVTALICVSRIAARASLR